MLFSRPDTPKLLISVSVGHLRVPWTHPTQHPKLHLDRFSRFCTASLESLCIKRGKVSVRTCVRSFVRP